jgi:ubiquitin C
MQISLKIHYGKTITLEVDPSDLIDHVKQKIQDKAGLMSDKPRLISVGRTLEDGRTLGSYDINPKYTLQLFPAFSIDKLDNDIKEGMIKNL